MNDKRYYAIALFLTVLGILAMFAAVYMLMSTNKNPCDLWGMGYDSVLCQVQKVQRCVDSEQFSRAECIELYSKSK